MQADEILEYCVSKKGVEESFPFNPETLVFKVAGKVFLLMALEAQPLKFSVKTDPEWSLELRAEFPQIEGAFHMNKTHWNTVTCEGLKPNLIFKLIDQSYDLVFQSLTKAKKEVLLKNQN